MQLGIALTCLSLAFSGLSSSFGLSSPQEAWNVVSPTEKILYVDFSLRADELPEGGEYSISYVVEEELSVIPLSLVSENIYKTDEVLIASVLAYVDAHLTVHVVLGEESIFSVELENHPFAKAQYDYVCLGAEEGVAGYGHYVTPKKNPGATYKTQRVFLVNENKAFYGKDDWGNDCVNAIGYFKTDLAVYEVVKMEHIVSLRTGQKYYYADIPEGVVSLSFLRLASTDKHDYIHYLEAPVESLSYGVCYFAGSATYESFSSVTTAVVHGADAGMLGCVVESYLTYGKGDANGCTKFTVSNLFSTWFAEKSATKEEMKEVKIMDYTGYSANGNSYVGLEKNASFSVNEKWNTMCSQAGIDPNTGKERSWFFSFLDISNPILLIGIVIGAGLIISIIMMFVMLKRRKRRDA